MHNFHVFQRANSPNYWVQWPKVTLFLSRNHCWLRPQAGKHDVLGPAVISLDISAGLQQLAVRKGPILCRFQSSSWAPWLSLVCSQCSYVVDSHHSHDQLILNIFDPMIAITISADKQTFVAEEHSCHLNVSVEPSSLVDNSTLHSPGPMKCTWQHTLDWHHMSFTCTLFPGNQVNQMSLACKVDQQQMRCQMKMIGKQNGNRWCWLWS